MKLEDVEHSFVAGIKTACLTRQQLTELFVQKIKDSSVQKKETTSILPLVVFDSNGHGISLAHTNDDFYTALKQADIIHADGQSVVSFSRWFGLKGVPERSATTDTIHDIPQGYTGNISHFLLGGNQDVVEKCASILSQRYENFQIAGTQHGYFSEEEDSLIIDRINQTAPDILWVGLGKPKEQVFIIKHRDKLNVPVIITCGGCYNYITGDYARAPQWMQNVGLEWLHRALTEPQKFLWRYITTNPHAIYCVIKYRHYKY